MHVKQRRDEPKDQEAERHRQLDNPERPRERDPRRRPAMSTTEANQQHHSCDRQREQHPVRKTVRRERGGGQRRVHSTNARRWVAGWSQRTAEPASAGAYRRLLFVCEEEHGVRWSRLARRPSSTTISIARFITAQIFSSDVTARQNSGPSVRSLRMIMKKRRIMLASVPQTKHCRRRNFDNEKFRKKQDLCRQ